MAETMPLPWHHVHLTHENRAQVALWYAQHLGARRGNGTKRSENLWFDNNLVQVQSDTAIKPPRAGEFDHIGIETPDVSATMQEAESAGGDLIVDPWGTRIQLVASDRTGFHHVMIACEDPKASALWYATCIGGKVIPCPWNRSFLAIGYDTMWLAFREARPAPTRHSSPRPICHIGWYTSDMDKTVARMLAAGCAFPVPIRPFGSVRLAFAEDPSGLWVELIEPGDGVIPK